MPLAVCLLKVVQTDRSNQGSEEQAGRASFLS